MTAHERFDDLLGPYLLGELPAGERAAFEDHLAGCARCREELDFLRTGTSADPQPEPPGELRERVMSVVRREARRRGRGAP